MLDNLRQAKSSGNTYVYGSCSTSIRFVGSAGELLRFAANEEDRAEEGTIKLSSQTEEFNVRTVDRSEASGYGADSNIATGVTTQAGTLRQE